MTCHYCEKVISKKIKEDGQVDVYFCNIWCSTRHHPYVVMRASLFLLISSLGFFGLYYIQVILLPQIRIGVLFLGAILLFFLGSGPFVLGFLGYVFQKLKK